MIQDFTFFANITASYVNRKKTEKNKSIQTKGKQRSEWSRRSFQAYIVFHPLGILNLFLMQTNIGFKTEAQKEESCKLGGKEKGWEPTKTTEEGEVSSTHLDSAFRMSEGRGRRSPFL